MRQLVVALVVAVVFVGGVWSAYVWIRDARLDEDRDDRIRRRDLNDPSLDFDELWRTGHGLIVENGRAYDRADMPLGPATAVILPEDQESMRITVRTDGAVGAVTILLEKRLAYHGHPGKTMRLRDFRESARLWKRSEGAALVLVPPRGWSSIEGGSVIHAIVMVPPGTVVRREPLSANSFDGRRDVSNDEARAAGWEEVPQQPLPKTEWPLPIERPPPWNSR